MYVCMHACGWCDAGEFLIYEIRLVYGSETLFFYCRIVVCSCPSANYFCAPP